jgi:hypothetical protein
MVCITGWQIKDVVMVVCVWMRDVCNVRSVMHVAVEEPPAVVFSHYSQLPNICVRRVEGMIGTYGGHL